MKPRRHISSWVILSASSMLGLCSVSASAQSLSSEQSRIELLEAHLNVQEKALSELRAQVEALKATRALPAVADQAPLPTSTALGGTWPKIPHCVLGDSEQIAAVLRDPDDLADCAQAQVGETQQRSARGRLPRGIARGARADRSPTVEQGTTTLAGRPLPAPGITPQIELGNKSRATLTLSIPINGRRCDGTGVGCSEGGDVTAVSPWTFTPSLTVSSKLSDGVGTVVDRRARPDRGDLDFVGDTSIKLGFEFLRYARLDKDDAIGRVEKFLGSDAFKACLAAQEKSRLEKPGLTAGDNGKCSRNSIVAWVMEPKADDSTTHGFAYARPELANKLQNLFWRTGDKAVPTWGGGASITYASQDFAYRQGALTSIPATADAKARLQLDASAPLAAEKTETNNSWSIEGHLLGFLPFRDRHPNATSPFHADGILFVPQIEHRRFYEFRPKTEYTLCTGATAFGQPQNCNKINVDRPYRRTLTSGSLEARLEFLNVPLLGKLAIAPRYSYTFDDNSGIIDLPLYFMQKDTYSAGIRFRYGYGQNDVFGNAEPSYSQVSIFFTPLRFDGF